MSSNESYHPSDSSNEMDESVGRISEDEDEIDDEDKDKDGDEENKDEDGDEDEEDNGEDEKEDGCSPSPLPSSLSHIAGLDLPGDFGQVYQPGPVMAPSPSPSQLGQDILPFPTPSEVVHPCTLSLSGRGHQRQYYMSSSSSLRSLNIVFTDWQMLNLIEQDQAQLLATCQKLEEDLGWVQAKRDTANAHCTIISHVVEETCKQLGVAHFNQEEAKRSKKAKERAASDAQKVVDEAVHTAHIHKDTVSKNFEKPLLSYKRKDDLITDAGALQLSTTGTVKELGQGTPH
ncbi:hypothetical protein SERLA73DRAFT_153732 [Serpula lacrymans var. lacrymans S7.3]|uniref:Uncharacterized protein n=1 Tax=Serpula lacrymans var. lacrymans (strain S7.3) TaxID=936435 RepID=F8Q273_SERL3|nr:hypothetical protein SERLA73DRAFT_153732 [Serpula lacrymans var. lacrymans S7.3]